MGLHYLIGAFTVGVIMPKSVRPSIKAVFEPLSLFVLLPFYFAVTGLKVAVDIGSVQVLLFFLLSTLAAMGGKILGTTIPSKIKGVGWREALQLGVLMQSKGFVEIVILTVLLDAGVISNSAFSALILMALVTTALTTPMYHALGSTQVAEIAPGRTVTNAYARDQPRAGGTVVKIDAAHDISTRKTAF
jgi:Kef-type K+ transport system membrane component KefB